MTATATASAPESGTEKPFRTRTGEKVEFDERMIYRPWNPGLKQFNSAQNNVKAYRALSGGSKSVVLVGVVGPRPGVGSELEDEDGNVYVVRKVTGNARHYCTVEKKSQVVKS